MTNTKLICIRPDTLHCNLKCSYCTARKQRSNQRPQSDEHVQFDKIWSRLHSTTFNKILLFVPFGELFVSEYYKNKIAESTRLTSVHKTLVQTNFLFNFKEYLQCIDPKKLGLWVTLHPSATTEKQRSRVISNIMLAKQEGMELSVGMVATESNLTYIDYYADLLEEIDVYFWLNANKTKEKTVRLSEMLKYDSHYQNEFRSPFQPNMACPAGNVSCFIRGDGSVTRCHRKGGEGYMGNILTEDIKFDMPSQCQFDRCDCYIGYFHLTRESPRLPTLEKLFRHNKWAP